MCFFVQSPFPQKTQLVTQILQNLNPFSKPARSDISILVLSFWPASQTFHLALYIFVTIRIVALHTVVKYTSKDLKTYEPGSRDSVNSDYVSAETRPFTRSSSSTLTFDWKTDCFICGGKRSPKRSSWRLVEVVVNMAQGSQSMYTRVIKAAEQRKDSEMLTRLYGCEWGSRCCGSSIS